MVIRAIYENGVFKPLEDVLVKEGTEAEVFVRGGEMQNGKKRKRSAKDFDAYGMWEDRDDIASGVEYVNRIRRPRLK